VRPASASFLASRYAGSYSGTWSIALPRHHTSKCCSGPLNSKLRVSRVRCPRMGCRQRAALHPLASWRRLLCGRCSWCQPYASTQPGPRLHSCFFFTTRYDRATRCPVATACLGEGTSSWLLSTKAVWAVDWPHLAKSCSVGISCGQWQSAKPVRASLTLCRSYPWCAGARRGPCSCCSAW
jgi:hypothetical protein